MAQARSKSRIAPRLGRPFFIEFASVIRKEFPSVPLMVTGRFSSRRGIVCTLRTARSISRLSQEPRSPKRASRDSSAAPRAAPKPPKEGGIELTVLLRENAVAGGDYDLVGLGRPAVLNPSIPNNIVFSTRDQGPRRDTVQEEGQNALAHTAARHCGCWGWNRQCTPCPSQAMFVPACNT
ncbi:hypothetical protein VTK56DRAFT_4897 [Thermocarpiscus australiensis]